jgi:putrescine aminotransferase
MGWNVGNFGWANKQIVNRLKRFSGPNYVYAEHFYKPWVELAQALVSIAPGDLNKCVRATTGTESVEAALQIARAYTGRKNFVALKGSYHGNSIAVRDVADGGQIPAPLDRQAADKVEQLLKTKEYAGFIMEPIVCNWAVHIPSTQFIARVRELCDAYGTLLIFDEIACGFGRTGKLFASEHFEIVPDIMCLGKAMGAGYAPIAATITTNQIAAKIADNFEMYSTFGWHPLAVEAALATIQFLETNRQRLFNNINDASDYFFERLSTMNFKAKSKVRVIGLAIAIEFESPEFCNKLATKCGENGLIVSTQGNSIVMWPALTIDLDVVKEGLDILEQSLQRIRVQRKRAA